MEKYYTPSKEEFHIGLECENRIIRNGEEIWLKRVITEKDFRDESYENVFKFRYRVKYLDESDLIELGWDSNSKSTEFSVDKGFWRVRIVGEGEIELDYEDNVDWEAGFSLYECKVKNKSEMKKLMEMLNIKNK